jgi:hypothetical protein
MKKPNIIWITLDGIRPHSKCKDLYDYPKVFDIMSKECIEFTKVVTSAPSTVMSVSSLMTSYPAFYLSRTFYSFNYDNEEFDSLPHILKEKGYNIYSVIAYHEIRNKLKGFFGDYCKKHWPKKINPFVYAWSGGEVNKIVGNLLKSGINKPFFLYVHYRKFPNTSKDIIKLIYHLKKSGLYKDSIFILSSDHGYTDKKPDSKLKGIVTSHDMMMDENSLYVPLLIKYPGCQIKKINKHISTLDTTPTIIDILGLDSSKFKFKGLSLIDIINNTPEKYEKRFFRTDNRYIFQPSRVTSIKDSSYKYLFSYENKTNEFYDVEKDPLEENNLIKSKDPKTIIKIKEFRKEFRVQEDAAIRFHQEYLFKKFKNTIKTFRNKSNNEIIKNIYISNTGSELFNQILKIAIANEFPGATINNKRKNVDLAIIHIINQTGIGYKNVFKKLKKIKPRKTLYIDYNMNSCQKPNLFKYALSHLLENRQFYQYSPKSFVTWFIRLINKKIRGEDIHKSQK